MATQGDLAQPEVWKSSFHASRARRADRAAARLRRLRARGAGGTLLAAALVSAALATGFASARGPEDRPARAAHVLKLGSRGPAVETLQRKLGIAADGVYGPQTRRAVRRFQRRRGLAADGVAGPRTLSALGLESVGSARRRGGRSGAGAILERIARCESGGNPRAVSPDGRYRGKYQFSRDTWRAVGGRGDPARASEAEQDRRARILYRRAGTAPWANCA